MTAHTAHVGLLKETFGICQHITGPMHILSQRGENARPTIDQLLKIRIVRGTPLSVICCQADAHACNSNSPSAVGSTVKQHGLHMLCEE